MKTTFFITTLVVLLVAPLHAQTGSINNTLGTGGKFTIKSGSDTLLSLGQSDGYLDLNGSLVLPVTISPTRGVIFKGADRFLHNYRYFQSDGFNTFLGIFAGNFAMGGIGSQASYNTGIGFSSLISLTTGSSNTALGYNSLYSNTNGNENTAVGYQSLRNNTGNSNTAVGYNALLSNGTGFQNTAVGHHSLQSNSGNYNTAVGYNAGSTITIGYNLTCIGIDANPLNTSSTDQITLGNSFVSSLRCNVTTITALSDARDKKNITDLDLGLDFLMNVKPRKFNWDRRQWYENNVSDGSKMKKSPTAGFIAQELDAVQNAEQAEWLNLVLKDNPDKLEATPGNLLPIMVKAIQELKTENEALRNELVMLRGSIAEQVKKEVQAALLKAVQSYDKTSRVSLNETKN